MMREHFNKPVIKLFFVITILLLGFPLLSFAFNCTVEYIIDGDTFICSGEKVRLTGVDTPESTINEHIRKQRALGDTQTILELGRKAKKFIENIMPVGTKVRLEFDIQKYDKYGRLFAYVWLFDGRNA